MPNSFNATPRDNTPRSKQHKRSRSGCFTCRLRRKKCDEGKPTCKACKHLGLRCDYKRPMWWGNMDQRKYHKEHIKDLIRQTQLAKKTEGSCQAGPISNLASPPSLCHHASSPEPLSDTPPTLCNSRSVSVDQTPLLLIQELSDGSFNDYFSVPSHPAFSYTPLPDDLAYNPDLKVECHTFVNDPSFNVDSSLYDLPSLDFKSDPPPEPSKLCLGQDCFDPSPQWINELGLDAYDFPTDYWPHAQDTLVDVEEADKPILDHFVDNISPLIYPILDATQQGSARSQVILPALESNKSFLHCCLSVAALHLKPFNKDNQLALDTDIISHRCEAVGMVCDDLERDINHEEILETTLALILYPSCAGAPDETLIDIPWHEHFKIVENLIERLALHETILTADLFNPEHNTFAATLTAWIDILGATMRGKSPVFASTWRQLFTDSRLIGLSDVMGCDDRLMYLISEIACLEEKKTEGMDEITMCSYIEFLGGEISKLEPKDHPLVPALSSTGELNPQHLVDNMTALFRLAARIYLISLVPGVAHDSDTVFSMVTAFTSLLELIPAGPTGFDRCLAWPILMAGSMSTPDSQFRATLTERATALDDQGSLARVRAVLCSLWAQNDFAGEETGMTRLHWREVMTQKGMDCLLI